MAARPSDSRHSRIRISLVVLAAALCGAAAPDAPLAAQAAPDADGRSAPEFHTGQWAAQFDGGSGLFGAGVLRFRSPNTAWTLDAATAVELNSIDSRMGGTSGSSSANVSTRIGLRRYHTPHGAIRAFHGVGLTGSLGRTSSEHDSGSSVDAIEQTTSSVRLGAFAELGASYFVTSHLALGARGVATAGYQRGSTELSVGTSNDDRTENGAFLQLGSVLFQVTLLF